jgi:MinD-like ATPase involved in chromosome partitioning or flagellar assembly
MSLPILTAIADAGWEADLAGELSHDGHGVLVVRRCVDLADLLAAATAGLARAVVLSGDLRRLDREAVSRLTLARVAVVGLVAAGDENTERRLRQLGVSHVQPRDATPEALSAAVHAAVAAMANAPAADADLEWADPARELPAAPAPEPATAPRRPPPGPGTVIAVWGPAGAPGRSTIAVNLATELAALGGSTLLIDADTYGGVVAQLIGVLDEAPGIAAACRLANAATLDLDRLAELALVVRPDLRVLTGITRAERWLELRPAALRIVLDQARSLAATTVVDCGFCLEQDEELAYDTAAPRRNGATLAVLAAADHVLGVAAADPVGLTRYLRALPDCTAVAGRGVSTTVVNRLRDSVVGPGDARRQVSRALDRYAGITDVHVVPEDRAGLDSAVAAGRTLTEAAPKSPARIAIRDLARTVAGESARKPGRRRARTNR